MDLFKIEELRRELLRYLNSDTSSNQKIVLLNDFFSALLNSNDETIIKAYVPEFISEYARLLEQYTPYFKSPDYTKNLLDVLEKLLRSGSLTDQTLEEKYNMLQDRLKEFEFILQGNNKLSSLTHSVSFPVIETFSSIGDRRIFGFLEQINIEIFKSQEDIFLIVPSEKEIDARLNTQIRISWAAALSIGKKYHVIKDLHHKVIIQFESRNGFYIGDSLGTALTVAFIKEILSHYNSPYLIDINENVAISGSIDERGTISPVSELIIQKKTKTVFYSPVNLFVVPIQDLPEAEKTLKQLMFQFPKRERLKITGVNDINDLLDRRSIVEIRKQNPVVRTGKYLNRNRLSTSVIIILLIVLSVLFLSDLDNNPAYISQEENLLMVRNRNGKILWTINTSYKPNEIYSSFYMLIDIDNDKTNEVLISGVNDIAVTEGELDLVCFDHQGEKRWIYRFDKIVTTDLEEHSGTYQLALLDTLSEHGNKFLYLIARNIPFYPSAIIKINLHNGLESGPVFWHAGAIMNALLDDFNEDGEKEIAVAAINNCYERGAVFSVNINKLDGQAPSEGNYIFKNIKSASLNNYTLLPKTDFSIHYKKRFSVPSTIIYDPGKREFGVISRESDEAALHYTFDANMKIKNVSCGDSYQVLRDELVDEEELNPPYTNTKEYFNLVRADAIYWDEIKSKISEDIKGGGTN